MYGNALSIIVFLLLHTIRDCNVLIIDDYNKLCIIRYLATIVGLLTSVYLLNLWQLL